MNLTLIPADGAVYVDGYSFSQLSFSAPAGVHALQWKGAKGWIEFVDRDDGTKPNNEVIVDLPDWAVVAKAQWDEAKAAEEAALAAAKNQPVTEETKAL